MAHQIDWYMGRRIIYAMLDADSLTLQPMQELNERLTPFVRACDSRGVHVIIDASRVRTLRTDIATIQAGFNFAKLPQVGWNILISDDPATRYLRMLISRTSKIRIRSFEALEEALFFLQDEDATLQMPFWSYEPEPAVSASV